MKKKDLIFISIIIILLISLIITIIYFKKNNNTMISGEVLAVGSNYLLIGTSDNEDYVINTNTKDYQIGDELKLSINNIKKNKTPYEATAKEGFVDLKTNFGITWDIIKELASNGITKLRDWYEIWRYQ